MEIDIDNTCNMMMIMMVIMITMIIMMMMIIAVAQSIFKLGPCQMDQDGE